MARFKLRKAEVKASKEIGEVAGVLKQYGDDVEIVVAATAHKAKGDDFDGLAKTRAENYKAALVEAGVPAKMLSVRSLGARELPENPPKGARNDRIELQIKVKQQGAK